MRSHRVVVLLVASCAFGVAALGAADDRAPIEDVAARASYSLGHQIGTDLRREGREIDPDALRRGLREGLAGADPAVDPEAMDRLLVGLKQSILATQRRQRREVTAERRDEGRAFLAANAEQPGVVSLESGLQYRVERRGTGRRPASDARVTVHYRSTTTDGSVVHDSRRGDGPPETLAVGAVIPGLGEALRLMREGARWTLYIPPDLAYGRRGPLADRAVVIDVELISIAGDP